MQHYKVYLLTKKRVKGLKSPILLEDVFDTITKSQESMGKYYGYAIPINNFKKVMGYTEAGYKTSLKEVIGQKIW